MSGVSACVGGGVFGRLGRGFLVLFFLLIWVFLVVFSVSSALVLYVCYLLLFYFTTRINKNK